MLTYAFWNNKGGTGKTSLAFQAVCRYAAKNPTKRILVVDVCPQANISELLLGGLTNGGSAKLLARHGLIPRCSIGGYFQIRLPTPYGAPKFEAKDFLTVPSQLNPAIPKNIALLCGDPLLELQSNAINTLANTQIPGTNTWIQVVSWLTDYLERLKNEFDVVFIDANPSFSMYTQIALAAADRLVLPVMADDSSRRAIQNAFSLVYGLKLPSEIYAAYAFATKLHMAERPLPKVHLIAKNRITQYMGDASAYSAVLRSIENDLSALVTTNPEMFTFADTKVGVVSVRDFQTAGVVAFARGCPFYSMPTGRIDIGGKRVRLEAEQKDNCVEAIDKIVAML
jgi:cellulose biosynthesis protein BcsQ